MEIVASPLDWTHIDEEQWARFLSTETGKRLIPHLLEAVPILPPGGDTNSILIRTGEVRAWQIVARTLLEMSHAPERAPEPETAYPPLEDDSRWADGKKIEEPPK